MFSIYISASALANAYLQEGEKPYKEQSEWFRVLRKQSRIYTYGYTPTYENQDDNIDFESGFSLSHIIEELSISYDIPIIPADDYISSLLDNNQKALEKPNAAFFLDIDSNKAENIQKKYGVICQSTGAIDSSVFTKSCIGVNFEKDTISQKGWAEIFKVPTELPSNTLCIIDRFLFTFDGQPNKDGSLNKLGITNIAAILEHALPISFEGIYSVLIICDKKHIKNRYIFQTMSDELFRIVYKLSDKRRYRIKLQLLAIDGDEAPYTNSITHNRLVFSNYYQIIFLNGVNILYYKGGKTFSKYNQLIRGTLMYNGDLEYIESDPPISSIETVRKLLKKQVEKWHSHVISNHFSYADSLGNFSITNLETIRFS